MKAYTHSYAYDEPIRSPLQKDQIMKRTTYSKEKSQPSEISSPFQCGDSSFSKTYTKLEEARPANSSTSTLDMRETLTYVEQILGDLGERGNFGLAKRYVQKLNNLPIKAKMDRLIAKM
jgi:hypothetical protein